VAPPTPPQPSLFPFVLSIALGALFGATALTAAAFVGVGTLAAGIFHEESVFPTLVFDEIAGAAIALAGLLACLRVPRSPLAGAIVGTGAGLLCGTGFGHYIFYLYAGNAQLN
jgi:hypothetical protein